ncbi:MAG: isoleucine--tRNA ligase [Erysipelotrichaceae bacterium]|nr:isoleucine--tRNA ligase [Erysipelotrichaceae bacterium]
MDYKNTLHMPKTDFEMRGNLPKKEPLILERWEKDDHYKKITEKNLGHESFILHDGPPYANNNLHAGTAMNRIIKDIIVRSKGMEGYYSPFFPGWDTHGLPIENAVQKLGVDRKKLTPAEFRKKCEEYAHKQIEIQMATEKRLGQAADFDHPYITLKKEFEARQIRSFAKMALRGLIFQGLKPIYWSPYNETAIADSEIVYYDKKDTTLYAKFDVVDGKGVLDPSDAFVIWTTTPWTIPSDQAITLGPDLVYAEVQTEKGKLIFLESLTEKLLNEFGLENQGVLRTFKGRELEGITVQHPLYDRTSLVCLANYVVEGDGTGCVHTSSGHGLDDFNTCQRYGIPVFNSVDEKGCMTEECGPELAGLFLDDCSKKVIEMLRDCGSLLATEDVVHSYPHDDRLKKPVFFRATVQWFASIDKIKEELLEAVHKVNWLNEWGEVRLGNMIRDREDWCISRQRLWGVPIPIIYCEDKTPIIEEEVFEHIADLFGQYGSNVWFEREAKDLLPEGYTNEHSPNGLFTKEKDIMDVWFDSGSSWNELIARGYPYPCDLYFEGSDQYRGWFNSSLIVSVANNGVAPYKSVLSHGYVCDSKGEKMSKSVGNIVNPLDVIVKYGADVLRLWAGTVDFKADMRIGDVLLGQTSDMYRKVRNTFRYMLGNVDAEDFDPKKDLVAYEDMPAIDRYFINKLNEINEKVQQSYNNYDFISVCNTLANFMSVDLSSYYLDFAKDILYIEEKDSKRRRSVQSVIYACVDQLVRLWAPVLCYTADEVWQHFNNDEATCVHYTHFPKLTKNADADELNEEFARANEVRSTILKALEDARQEKFIGKNLEAEVVLTCSKEDQELLEKLFGDMIHQWLQVSAFSFGENGELKAEVRKAKGKTCPRCWNVTKSDHEEGLCTRCQRVLRVENVILQ